MPTDPFRNYDSWLTTNREQERSDEAWERYAERYNTPENQAELIVTIVKIVADSQHMSMPALDQFEAILKRGTENEDISLLEKLYGALSITPDFDTWHDEVYIKDTDTADDREPTEEELHPELRDE